MAEVTITVDGKKIRATSGSLLIDVCKRAGIEIPSFCYYPGLSLQGACRMCLVEIAKTPKLQTACTTIATEGMIVTTDSPTVRQSRKAMLEFVLQNHPLDCPVCDAGGQCELQDATYTYGAPESRLVDIKNHRDEQQWSPIVYFDRPRCIMCYRCVRVCGEGMDVWALGIANRNSSQLIVPNKDEHLECEECGMCIDICPVGALTSGPYRYKPRPWEMKHTSTICTHCGDGCTTTLGTRPVEGRMTIMRGTNRDKGGINEDFLCIKGRYAFDFVDHAERLTMPLMRIDGALKPVSWDRALSEAASRLDAARQTPGAIGVVGSNHSTNEENYILQKFARTSLNTNNIDHRRTADYPLFFTALRKYGASTASMADVLTSSAILLVGGDPTYQHPLLAWQIRNNVRLNGAHLYIINSRQIKLCRQAKQFIGVPNGCEGETVRWLTSGSEPPADSTLNSKCVELAGLASALRAEQDVVIVFGAELQDQDIENVVKFGTNLPLVKFICLSDDANSRGAADMGLSPDLLPGYETDWKRWSEAWGVTIPEKPGMNLPQMVEAAQSGLLSVLHVVGSDPVKDYAIDVSAFRNTYLIVEDLFLTSTAAVADLVLPSSSPYEKSGTFTNTCGDLQVIRKAADCMGPRSDLEIILQLAERLGANVAAYRGNGPGVRGEFGESRGAQCGEVDRQAVWMSAQGANLRITSFDPDSVLREIQNLLPDYRAPHVSFSHDVPCMPSAGEAVQAAALIKPYGDDLFSSEAFGRYSANLNSVLERSLTLPYQSKIEPV
jgi:NADH-quinone oxidoreductase subunit G